MGRSTWDNIGHGILIDVDDESGVFHTPDAIRSYMEDGELFVNLSRLLFEKTVSLPLVANVAEINVLDLYPDFILPVRMSLNGKVLTEIRLDSTIKLHPTWPVLTNPPRNYMRLGGNMLGFFPVPHVNCTVEMVYIAAPPTTLSTPPAGEAISIADQYAQLIMDWGTCIASAVQGDIPRAMEGLQAIVKEVGMERDTRFIFEGGQRRSSNSPESSLIKDNERP